MTIEKNVNGQGVEGGTQMGSLEAGLEHIFQFVVLSHLPWRLIAFTAEPSGWVITQILKYFQLGRVNEDSGRTLVQEVSDEVQEPEKNRCKFVQSEVGQKEGKKKEMKLSLIFPEPQSQTAFKVKKLEVGAV